MNNHYDVIVIGGGVIGSAIAFYLSEQDKKVLIIEKNKLASKASSAAAGMIGAQSEFEQDSPLFRLARKSREMFPELAERLQELSGINIEYVKNGILKLAVTHEDVVAYQSIISTQQKLGEKVEWMTRSELKLNEPALSNTIKGAMYIPSDGNVSAFNFSTALAHSAVTLGATILEDTKVVDFIRDKNKVIGVKTEKGAFYAEETIVAGGAWSEQLTNQTGISLHTYPVKGECFSVTTQSSLIKRTIYTKNCYIVPKAGNRLLIGATEKADTFDETVSLKGLSELMDAAMEIIPALENTQWEKAWAGIRPQTRDELPYLGRHPLLQGLSIATGHYRNGILLAPITGKLMAELIDGKVMDSHFDVKRNVCKEVEI